jgi:hypothetical protein
MQIPNDVQKTPPTQKRAGSVFCMQIHARTPQGVFLINDPPFYDNMKVRKVHLVSRDEGMMSHAAAFAERQPAEDH